ncbi:hypothetical protein GV791_20675 [Nocardia cyriacigeorgica]|uniref:Uncharacterized protein n=1 Tax=Nocardia cyriacigeorgica TaxID=135487 RepID=A0A6P1CUI3_9NOCA|nr:hypothetical protein [Nocardia cyriacigeorgica]MBF6080675.1 hypothetical protein [Nocardia cyriacigeorgica]MBF6288893.1 hypothetical protein [Nocardia cyriacigeorgica]MBF6423509.1 hypothetical protein [Nocardia cyriacigeorgica]NEW34956.1 hypothetical protein [Nocardia cyriacigeorgica]
MRPDDDATRPIARRRHRRKHRKSTTRESRKNTVDRIEIDADTEPVDQHTSTSENHTTGGAA